MFKGTREWEPLDCETLYFSPSWFDEETISQSISIASAEDGLISIMAHKAYNLEHPSGGFVHFVFLPEEVDMLIEALQKAKELAKSKDIKI